MSEIIEEARKKNIDLEVFELEPQKIGLYFVDTRVELANCHDLTNKMREADYIITTAMIFVTDTADEIFRLANENDIKLIMYMESGSNFGEQLINFGADAVLAEYFPYYDFFGNTRYSIFKKSH